MANTVGITTSRLLTSTEALRKTLAARNIYAPDTEYPINTQTTVNKTVDAINSVIAGITPFKSINLENSVFGRIVTNQTPISTIGLAMLAKQMALNSMSHASQQVLPVLNLSNVLTGKPIISFSKNYNITVKANTSFLEKLSHIAAYWYPNRDYPFKPTSTNDDYIKNSGKGQLSLMYTAINRNPYKQGKVGDVFYEYADLVKVPINPRDVIYNIGNKTFFNYNDNREYPYLKTIPQENSIAQANAGMNAAYVLNGSSIQEYAPTAEFIDNNFGSTISKVSDEMLDEGFLNLYSDYNMNSWVGDNTEFSDLIENKVVWGRDGTTYETDAALSGLQGLPSDVSVVPQNLSSGFNINAGLLEYTRNLINATEGSVGDITRKAYIKDGKITGFNGSALWRAPSTSFPENVGKVGLRQHTVLDQYDRFAKAIRFNGNNLYQGNQDSVIFNSVLPRIHPVLNKEGVLENKNMMFSIENLAVRVISKDGFGIIDDEYGSPIPASEVGPFNGRVMWFPPYNLEINETATAKYESTVMVGRNEPMYNYMNSERSATLNFSLLVDYPPQLRNFANSETAHKDIAEFFAFGGNPIALAGKGKGDTELRIKIIEEEINKIKGGKTIEPKITKPTPISIYFPNDVPSKENDNINTVIDDMYKGGDKNYHYEIDRGCKSSDDASYALNASIYWISGMTSTIDHITGKFVWEAPTSPSFSQYEYSVNNQIGFNSGLNLNQVLKNVYDNEYLRKYWSINIVGAASKLYIENSKNGTEAKYNEALGQRRADATKVLVEKRLIGIYGKSPKDLGIDIISTTSIGSTAANLKNATADAIKELSTKQERTATIEIYRNSKTFDERANKLTIEEEETIKQLQIEIQVLTTQINNAKSPRELIYNERKASETAILNGFKSVTGNHLYPAFHSQTPEDFHKRLTFLQQCTRQGAAKRYDVVDENGILRAKNSVFGRQPICILRVGDFFYTKVIIENVTIDYTEAPWDMNPEGFGMQPMIAKVTLQMKLIGGQSLKGPIDALQNAVSFNYYANSSYSSDGMYLLPSAQAEKQEAYRGGIVTTNKEGILKEFNDRNIETLKNLKSNNK